MRQTRISIRPRPSVTKKIEESVKGNSDKPAHKIYKETVTEGQSVTDKPRNIRQCFSVPNVSAGFIPTARKSKCLECSTIEKFKDCKMSRMQIKVTKVNAMTRFLLSIHFQNFIECYFFIVQLSLLPFPFDLRTSRNFQGRTAITNSSRNIHGTFTDFRTYDNYGHFMEYFRNIH